MMRIINVEDQERTANQFISVRIAGKPLKKQKSITRLFSSSSKALRVPPHPNLVHQPTTPPKTFTPLTTPSQSPETFPTRTQSKPAIQALDKADQSSSGRGKGGLPVVQEIQNQNVNVTTNGEDSPPPTDIRPSEESDSEMPEDASTNRVAKAGEPALHGSSVLPPLPERSSSLAAPTPLTGRMRGASASSHILQPTPLRIATPFRPSTAAGMYRFNQHYPKGPLQVGAPIVEGQLTPISAEERFPSGAYSPWELTNDSAEVRTSLRSALTSNSSFYDATSTERSSVATKNTSIGGLIYESQSSMSKHASMTVDDAIDMYAAGFSDDIDSPKNAPVQWPLGEVESRQSLKVAEAIYENIEADTTLHARPLSAKSTSSAAIMSGNALRTDSPAPAPAPSLVQVPTAMRDQYGFLKANHQTTNEQYDAWNATYRSSQKIRTQKWLLYMRENSLPTHAPFQFPSRSAKTQRFIRKGIPPDWRGNAWFFYAGGDRFLQKHPGLFSTLVSRSHSELSNNDKDMIERDLHRTFPDNIHFKPEPTVCSFAKYPSIETPLLSSLRRVLQAFALYCPRIGYCQSLNFIAGLLLVFLPEEKAFWMLHIITTDHLPGTHDVSLEGANVDLWVLMLAFKQSLPALWPKIGNVDGLSQSHPSRSEPARLPTISLCTTSWFMSLFIGTLPIESVLRVWDVLFYEGSRTLFRVALAVFKLGEARIRAISDPMEIFQLVQTLPRGMLDVGVLMETAFRRGGGVSQEWVEKRRRQRKKWYASARAQAAASAALGPDCGASSAASSPMLSKANSVWRRRVGQQRLGD